MTNKQLLEAIQRVLLESRDPFIRYDPASTELDRCTDALSKLQSHIDHITRVISKQLQGKRVDDFEITKPSLHSSGEA